MMVIRPSRLDDLDDLEEMAFASMGGITSLPTDRRLLHEKVERSLFAFSRDVIRPKGEAYLFVLEDTSLQKAVGCSGILSKMGGYEPVYRYEEETFRLHSNYVQVNKRLKLLTLHRIHNGPSEVGTLFLLSDFRQGGVGRLLSLSRFLFMGLHRERFEREVGALMRGILDEEGIPLFWTAVCAPFFPMDFRQADQLRYSDPRFMADLAPTHPLYVSLLPPIVQQAIGKCQPNTMPALKILEKEGFTYSHTIDIFDAGPFYTCPVDKLATVQQRREASIAAIDESIEGEPLLVANHQLDFRCCSTPLAFDDNGHVRIGRDAATALKVDVGDIISYREGS